jgi:hypothetical protein
MARLASCDDLKIDVYRKSKNKAQSIARDLREINEALLRDNERLLGQIHQLQRESGLDDALEALSDALRSNERLRGERDDYKRECKRLVDARDARAGLANKTTSLPLNWASDEEPEFDVYGVEVLKFNW